LIDQDPPQPKSEAANDGLVDFEDIENFDDSPSLARVLLELEQRHRELDQAIALLYDFPYRDQIQLQRLKKQKLRLKDQIARVKDAIIPDLNA
jgi:hypothetical protein